VLPGRELLGHFIEEPVQLMTQAVVEAMRDMIHFD
jgi:hypothetical protein